MRRTRRSRGFNLPELMIALVIGLLLLAAFLTVLQHCRAEFAANESLARLEDNARQALSVLIPDVEHAGFYGFSDQPSAVLVGGLPAGIDDCGADFADALASPVQGADNTFRLGGNARNCRPTASAGGAHAGSDTLTLRHASLDGVAPHAGRLQLYTRALAASTPQMLFADGRAPGPVDPQHVIRDLEVRSYYIANDSVGRAGWPALRVKALTESGGAAQFRDEEMLPGIEDLQIEFCVATRAADGTPVTRFVSPDDPAARTGTVIAARLWLRVRSDATEPGFHDDRTLRYANITFSPSAAEAAQRRLLVTRTVALRNAGLPP